MKGEIHRTDTETVHDFLSQTGDITLFYIHTTR